MKRIVIAAPSSGSGKTTVTLALMAALARRGLTVAPFKVGPDFIDPGYHRLATGATSVNLDGWICGHDFIRDTFAHHAARADIAIVEGVMGLFDGIDGTSEAGSSAQMAKLLGAPVVLVVDARSQARSAAALVHGFATFDPALRVAGVVFNNVASANHEQILREAVSASRGDIRVIGCIPRDPALVIPSRHLGLITAEENPLTEEFLWRLAEEAERSLDLDALISISAESVGAPPLQEPSSSCNAGIPVGAPPPARCPAIAAGVPLLREEATKLCGTESVVEHRRPVRIGVARDAAFCFAYEDNLRLLSERGAELVFFSPLADPLLPEGISGVYLPGGYPELFAPALAGNESLKAGIRGVVEAEMPVYAECGGFIYLTRGLESDGGMHHFAGIFPVSTRMLPRRKALGYREIALLGDSIIGEKGAVARGHEFHYSETEEMPEDVDRLYAVTRKGVRLGEEGYRYKNCLASYIHLHFGSSPAVAETFVGHCRKYMNGSLT